MTKPTLFIQANGRDVSSRLSDRLVSFDLVDKAGLESDRLTLGIEDVGETLEWPGAGAELTIALAAPGGDPVAMGAFTVDAVAAPLIGGTLTITASAARFPESFKTARSAGWPEVKLGDLVTTVAQRHGFDARIDPELAAILIPHISQTDESDMNLLTRIARDHDAISKPAGGRLLFLKRGSGRTASGAVLPVITIARDQVIDGEVTATERDQYRSVEARWRDLDAAETRTVTIGQGDPVLKLRSPFPDQQAAAAAARSRYNRIQRGKATLNLTIDGDPRIAAESKIRLAEFRDGANGLYTVDSVTHHFGEGDPYRTRITGELAET